MTTIFYVFIGLMILFVGLLVFEVYWAVKESRLAKQDRTMADNCFNNMRGYFVEEWGKHNRNVRLAFVGMVLDSVVILLCVHGLIKWGGI